MSELPKGWGIVPLEDICTFNPRHFPDTDRSLKVSFVPMPSVSDVSGVIEAHIARPLSEVWKGYTHFREGDVIFAKITPCMENGKIAVAKGLRNGMACGSTEFYVLRPAGEISANYVWRFLRQKSFRNTAQTKMTGAVGQRRVPKRYLEQYPLPLPPAPEQKRIVEKLDSLSAWSTRARRELAHIPRLIARYKQSILAVAFSGELSGMDQAEFQSTHIEWETATLGDLLEDIRYGTSKKCEFDPNLRPVLRIPNIGNRQVLHGDLKHAEFNEKETEKLALDAGDVLIIRSNGSLNLVGKPALVSERERGFLFAGYLIRLRLNQERIVPSFLCLWLESDYARMQIEQLAKSTSGVNNINSRQISDLQIRLPEIAKQAEIVETVSRAFDAIDRLVAEHTKASTLLDQLDQAILAKAFRGELVPQDANDEPANFLLERIKLERSSTSKKQRRSTGKTMAKINRELVVSAVQSMPTSEFGFDELREMVSGDYDTLKEVVFSLLSESDPPLKQVFDEDAKAMKFVRAD